MSAMLGSLLAQMDESKLDALVPRLSGDSASYAPTWVIASILVAAILLITFKISKRNAVEKD